jgi:hypothetical protein
MPVRAFCVSGRNYGGEPCGGQDHLAVTARNSRIHGWVPRVMQGRPPSAAGHAIIFRKISPLRRRNGSGNGRCRSYLESIQLFSECCDLIGQLFRRRLLGNQLVLNDLQLVDRLLLSYPQPFAVSRISFETCSTVGA